MNSAALGSCGGNAPAADTLVCTDATVFEPCRARQASLRSSGVWDWPAAHCGGRIWPERQALSDLRAPRRRRSEPPLRELHEHWVPRARAGPQYGRDPSGGHRTSATTLDRSTVRGVLEPGIPRSPEPLLGADNPWSCSVGTEVRPSDFRWPSRAPSCQPDRHHSNPGRVERGAEQVCHWQVPSSTRTAKVGPRSRNLPRYTTKIEA